MSLAMQITVSCRDPRRLSAFWCVALGYVADPPPEGFSSWEDALADWGVPEEHWNDRAACVDPDGVRPRMYFERAESVSSGGRLRVDVVAGGGRDVDRVEQRRAVDAHVSRLVSAGGTIVTRCDDERRAEYYVVMADQEGNEFRIS